MSFLEILSLVLAGAGTLASVLGVFFAIYARQNGRAAREFVAELITSQNKDMRQFLAELTTSQNKDMREFIAAQNKDTQEFLAQVLERLGDRISQEGQKTREEIGRLRQSSG